jgi:RimJ/RimL family protein N-acetyltransferase
MRRSYRLPAPWEQSSLTGLPKAPEGFELRRIDDGLLASQLVNLQEVRGWIDSFWATPQDFLHTGFGYCAITGDTIASWCLTVFAAGEEREVGLATMPEYRQRGLATLVAVACIEHAMIHGLIPHCHCWADNLPSRAVAEKAGFRLERQYLSYQLTI